MNEKTAGIFVGSLRKKSYNRMMAHAVMALAPAPLKLRIVEIGDLPMYNEDLDAAPPACWERFRQEVAALDAVLFITAEYNRSVPAVLKNALDVGSRPPGHNVWNGKPGAVMSVSIGATGGFGATHHLRQSLVVLNVPTMAQPEAYIGNAAALFTGEGYLTDPATREFVAAYLRAFADWVNLHTSGNRC